MDVLNRRLLHATNDTQARDKLARMAPGRRSTVIDARRGWRSGPPVQRATPVTTLGDPLRHCARTALGYPSRIAHMQLSCAHRTPSAAVSTRCPAESSISFFAISCRASCTSLPRSRSPSSGCSRAARWCIGEPGGAADRRSVTALKRHQEPALSPALISLASKSS